MIGYLAGSMRGQPAEIVTLMFKVGAEKLRRQGHTVFSPFEHDVKNGFEYGKGTVEADNTFTSSALLADITFILQEAEVVWVLPGWEKSRGVAAEIAAAVAVDKPVIYPEEWFHSEPDVAGGDVLKNGDILIQQTWSHEKGWN